MARIRSIKPEIWMSAQVMTLSLEARLLFIGLITQADDEGRGSAEPRRLKAAIFGGDDVTSESVRRWLDELVAQKLIVVYAADQHGPLFSLLTWKHHQKIDRPKQSGYPAPPDRQSVVDESTSIRRGSEGSEGSEGGGIDGASEGADAPPTKLVRAGGERRASRIPEDFTLTPSRARFAVDSGVEPERTFAKFRDYWRAKSGSSATKLDWDATWRNWCRSEGERNPRAKGGADNGLPFAN